MYLNTMPFVFITRHFVVLQYAILESICIIHKHVGYLEITLEQFMGVTNIAKIRTIFFKNN